MNTNGAHTFSEYTMKNIRKTLTKLYKTDYPSLHELNILLGKEANNNEPVCQLIRHFDYMRQAILLLKVDIYHHRSRGYPGRIDNKWLYADTEIANTLVEMCTMAIDSLQRY